MGFSVKIKVSGDDADSLLKADEILDNILDEEVTEIEQTAKANVDSTAQTSYGESLPIGGMIKSNFYVEKLPMHKEVGVNPFSFEGRYRAWAAFLEFGTGTYIDIPQGLTSYARTFIINGRGTILPSAFLFTATERQRAETMRKIKERI